MLKFKRQMLRAMLWLTAFSPLMGCANTNNPTPTTAAIPNVQVVVKPDCVNWATITYSAPPDSDATVRQIIKNNERRKEACG